MQIRVSWQHLYSAQRTQQRKFSTPDHGLEIYYSKAKRSERDAHTYTTSQISAAAYQLTRIIKSQGSCFLYNMQIEQFLSYLHLGSYKMYHHQKYNSRQISQGERVSLA